MSIYLARPWCGVAASILTLSLSAVAEDWTLFRGPNGSGVSAATGYPIDLGDEKAIVWKSPVRPCKS